MIIEALGLQLRPYTKGPCWQLWKQTKGHWTPCELYPSSVEHGLSIIFERAARESRSDNDLSGALRELHQMHEAIITAIEAAQVTVEAR
jgi:hypothetical protein